jgi:predicted nucleic acid-binding protein
MRWIVDTSAWARRGIPEIAAQINAILDEDPTHELVLTGPILIEILREPQGTTVAETRADLEAGMTILPVTPATQAPALDALVRLADHHPDAHRLPVTDLLTAAMADHHGCGIIHVDGDFELLAKHSGLTFEHRRLGLPSPLQQVPSPATRQRELRRQLARQLHELPVADAERLLERFLVDAHTAGTPPAP